ncbi:MAG: glucosamine-6-phosphate deaminase [Bacillota bacterium]|nr:glucosamine-6-phosphate deaminase [Bacillota bacterium]
MKTILCDSYEEMSKAGALIIADQLKAKPDSVLGFATGSTPVGMYTELAKMNKNGEMDFSKVTTFNLDEYYPIDPKNQQSYRYFMNENLFNKINIDISKTFVPEGYSSDSTAACKKYEKMIKDAGGIDLQVLGIGVNGHIGFNEPAKNLKASTHVTDLTESTIEANSRFFASREDVPRQAITMGIGTILKSKKIILLITGENKSKALNDLLGDDIITDNPATFLKVHNDVTLICDKEAYYGRDNTQER